jgi:hypothetical protein
MLCWIDDDVNRTRALAAEFRDGKFDFAARRRRLGPIFAVGLAFYVASQVIAGLRS